MDQTVIFPTWKKKKSDRASGVVGSFNVANLNYEVTTLLSWLKWKPHNTIIYIHKIIVIVQLHICQLKKYNYAFFLRIEIWRIKFQLNWKHKKHECKLIYENRVCIGQ